jgi:uncharacterized membrane protein YiaA
MSTAMYENHGTVAISTERCLNYFFLSIACLIVKVFNDSLRGRADDRSKS